ncbi:MAG: 4-hydroxy-tetrahydrodipicolinate reductase [Parvularculaceae bacterium]
MSEIQIVVAGAAGRMGEAILEEARAQGVAVAGALEREGHGSVGTALAGVTISDRPGALAGKGVLIDFTTPQASLAAARLWAGSGAPLVIGTTGFSAGEEAEIKALAARAPIVKSGNFSLGVNLLAALVKKAAAALGPDYDIEIVEAHHRAKVDAPSGTALLLGRAAAAGRGELLEEKLRLDRKGARETGAIGMAVIRGGGIIGDHDVTFAGASETVTLSHRALDRSLFAKGALAAARWAAAQPPGLYSMAEVLGL